MRTLPLLVLVVAVSPATGCVASTRMAVWPAGAKPAGPYSPAVLVDGTLYVTVRGDRRIVYHRAQRL